VPWKERQEEPQHEFAQLLPPPTNDFYTLSTLRSLLVLALDARPTKFLVSQENILRIAGLVAFQKTCKKHSVL
jgi:hypothetical protein